MFVRARQSDQAGLGIGKLVDRRGALCSVEYFDAPTSDRIIVETTQDLLEIATIPEQTRMYHLDEATASWEIGRLLDDHGSSQLIQFPNGKTRELGPTSLFVRWTKPILDPTPFLANKINESPRFSDGRSAFIRSQTRQRSASMGMSSVLGSAIELEAHQLEVVRRILQDPVQRYLLADEVGLGKTIEAGILVRQCVLDSQDNVILVLVPTPLVAQWRGELSSKFFLEGSLDRSVHVIAFNDRERISNILPKATMMVIDEAHHLTNTSGDGNSVYALIAQAAPKIERILLLSATPALHNERGFLEMLHLLDPSNYPLDGEDAFRRKIESRQELAEIVAALTPENALYLDYTIDQLATLFPNDDLLQSHVKQLSSVVERMPAEDDPELEDKIGQLRAHLSEVYRLHRRILRNRRRSVGGLTPDRSGAQIVRYSSSDRASLSAAIDVWRFEEATELDADGGNERWAESVKAFLTIIDCASQYCSGALGIDAAFRVLSETKVEMPRWREVAARLSRPGLFTDRAEALVKALRPILEQKSQCVIFCTDAATADHLARYLADAKGLKVDRHSADNDAWFAFMDDQAHSIIICDRVAEEGLNLQGGKKVVIHFDIPFNANRIEQRLGRVDRYGAGNAVKSLLLVCDDDPFEIAWTDYLDTALRVFDRSVASLQFLIDNTFHGLARALFTDGSEAIRELTEVSKGVQGAIEREIKAIDQQDALDALGRPSADLVDDLSDVDDDWHTLAAETAVWFDKTLQFGRLKEALPDLEVAGAAPFRYCYSTSNGHTLVPLPTFLEHCSAALDLTPRTQRERAVKTIPYTFRRRTALHRSARTAGVGLLRYGDAFISGMTDLTEADDRGRSFAMWRYDPTYIGDPVGDIFFRFDFILETCVEGAAQILVSCGRKTDATVAAVRRRGDMALPPFYRSVWLDRELNPVVDPKVLARLAQPYRVEPDVSGRVDFNLNSKRWKTIQQLEIPEVAYWYDICFKARSVAESVLRSNGDVVETLRKADQRAAEVDRGRLGQLRARNQATTSATDIQEYGFEEQLATALRKGISAPQIRVDLIGAVFLSASKVAVDRLTGGY